MRNELDIIKITNKGFVEALDEVKKVLSQCDKDTQKLFIDKFKKNMDKDLRAKIRMYDDSVRLNSFEKLITLKETVKYILKKCDLSESDKTLINKLYKYLDDMHKHFVDIKYS